MEKIKCPHCGSKKIINIPDSFVQDHPPGKNISIVEIETEDFICVDCEKKFKK